MKLAYVSMSGRGATDACLAEAVARLRAAGLALAGTVQTNPPRSAPGLREGRAVCDMDLHVLPGGPVLRISQDLGAGSRGCRLDSGALEEAVARSARRLARAEALVVNKFGKTEAEGRGFVPVIAAALERDLPVLVGVNALNLEAFLAFAGDLSLALPADPARVAAWMLNAARASRAA